MYKIKNIINIEKFKLFSNIKFINFKNEFLKFIIKGDGCYGLKFNFLKNKNFLKKNEILILKKKIKFIINFFFYKFILNSNFIKKKNKILIKNNYIKNFCKCGKSFNLKI